MEQYYEDMQVGEEYESPARTITETDVVNFSAFSGDWSPVHSDEEWCKQTPFKTRIGHGLLGLALTEGLKFRIPEFSAASADRGPRADPRQRWRRAVPWGPCRKYTRLS